MTTFDFQTQLSKGEAAERKLDAHFGEWFEIAPASRDEQRQGIDRWFVGKQTGQRFSVEMKTDWRAAQTGNAFIEVMSVDTAAKAGWALTSAAEVLLYYCPGQGGEQVYWIQMAHMRKAVEGWQRRYPLRHVQNAGYQTSGRLVPLWELERLARRVVSL